MANGQKQVHLSFTSPLAALAVGEVISDHIITIMRSNGDEYYGELMVTD